MDAKYEAKSVKNIGAVSVGIMCEPEPRLLTHAFMLSSRLVTGAFQKVAATMVEDSQLQIRGDLLASALTSHLLQAGVTLASLVQMARLSPDTAIPAVVVEKEVPESHPAGEYVPHLLGEGVLPVALGGQEHKEPSVSSMAGAEEEPTIHDHAITRMRPVHNVEPERRLSKSTSTSSGKTTSSTSSSGHGKTISSHRSSGTSTATTSATARVTKAPVVPIDYTDNAIYKNQCLTSGANLLTSTNPTLWCNLRPTEVVFARYGGAVLRTPGILCEDTMKAILDATVALALSTPQLRLRLPENPYGGIFKDLYRQYSQEQWQWLYAEKFVKPNERHYRNAHASNSGGSGKASEARDKHRQTAMVVRDSNHNGGSRHGGSQGTAAVDGNNKGGNVCFLVRSAHVHSLKRAVGQPPSRLVKMDIKLLIQSKFKCPC